ncbi:SDR family oxidoreductase [Sorangium sp. So ce296]|uniref:Short-chain dehydrogenase n=1 Tax=Sorangium cellulosum TaxID=56 RepID=A0A150TC05_SORCE|nr:short-chain dehydrogenase [Sorangium cellulosum]KYG02530.1 short-chain dehydrogenase [Sorangium cellulosum]
MDLGLENKVVMVTGGARGIGEGIVRALAEEKAIPVIIGRDESDNSKVCRSIVSQGSRCGYVTAELTSNDGCRRATEETISKFERIDALINNAGVNDGVGLASGSYEKFIDSLHRNLIHYYLMAHYSLPELIRNKGSIVNIGSKTAETGQGNTSAYAASNGGRNALTREWAVELLPYEVRVNSVIVAECYTPSYDTWIKTFPDPEEKLKLINERIPLGKRMTTKEEIAAMAVFLLSQKSSHITGQLIHVDGGYVHLDRALL